MKNIKTIGLILPSGKIKDKELIDNNIETLKKYFKVKKYYSENNDYDYVADSIENRVQYFENCFLDNEIDAIVSVRGGFGAIQIVDKINWKKIKDTNKIYFGSSDATILLIALYKNTNAKLYHSLMISNGFLNNINKNLDDIKLNIEPVKKGPCKGILWGGNLSSLVSIFSGESFIPDNDIILFLEDLAEPKYKIEKMLFEIYRNEKLKSKIKGIIFGDFYFEKNEILPLLKQYSSLFNVPSYLTFDITHKENNITLPFGKIVEIKENKINFYK